MTDEYYKRYEPLFGAWYIERLLGEGSFGKVYEIRREEFGRVYKSALKTITIPQSKSEIDAVRDDGVDEESMTAYFRSVVEELMSEFDIMEALKGESTIVSYEDHAVIPHEDGIGWDILIRMELLTPLVVRQRSKPLNLREVVRLGTDICRALELCHLRKIVHRDIKPENLFLSNTGRFKLGDFGIARTIEKTTSGLSKKGTYAYMAPEVFRGEAYGASVDLYSLGLVLYRLLNNNRAPFLPPPPTAITHNDREAALARQFSGEPLPPIEGVPQALMDVIHTACAFRPEDRYATPTAMRLALESLDLQATEAADLFPAYASAYAPEEPEPDGCGSAAQPDASESETAAMYDATEVMAEQSAAPRKKKKWILIAAALLCAAAAAAGAAGLFGRAPAPTADVIPAEAEGIDAQEKIVWNDDALEEAVRSATGIYDRAITRADVESLSALDLSGASVQDIGALEAFPNLQSLYLSDNPVRDIGALAGLTELRELYLHNTAVGDIGALAGLTKLERLGLSDTAVSDVGALQGLTQLQSLNLEHTAVGDVGALAGLTGLEELWLNNTAVGDIGALAGLTKLERLGLAGTGVRDIGLLAGFTNLRSLSLEQTAVSDLSALSGLTNLQKLYLSGAAVSEEDIAQLQTKLPDAEIYFDRTEATEPLHPVSDTTP